MKRLDDFILAFVSVGLFVLMVSCAYLRKGCQVVDLTDDACHAFILANPDGTKSEVKMSAAQAREFVRTGAVPADGGCPK